MIKYPDTAPLPPPAPPRHKHAWYRQSGGWNYHTLHLEPINYTCPCGAERSTEIEKGNVITFTIEPRETAEEVPDYKEMRPMKIEYARAVEAESQQAPVVMPQGWQNAQGMRMLNDVAAQVFGGGNFNQGV